MAIVSILTDFGVRDGYVAAMRGMILRLCPDARFADITQEIPPGDVAAGAFVLSQCHWTFPEGTTFLAVVDPGVGTERAPIAVQAGGRYYVGPDNGLLGFLAPETGFAAHRIDIDRLPALPGPGSRTFHGRDLFAPAAALLARGQSPVSLGSRMESVVVLPPAGVRDTADGFEAEVAHVDHYGNAILALETVHFVERFGDRMASARLPGGAVVGEAPSFGHVSPGEALLYRGSGGCFEIAVNRGNAARSLGLDRGRSVLIAVDAAG